jgi:glutamyl-tRNA synthetase
MGALLPCLDQAATPHTPESGITHLEAAAAEHGLKLGKAQALIRVAVTARLAGLPLFESVEVLGRERTLARIDAAAAKLAGRGPVLSNI